MLDDSGKCVAVIGQGILVNPRAVDCSVTSRHIVAADWGNQVHVMSADDGQQLIRSFCSHGDGPQQTQYVYGLCVDHGHNRIVLCDYNNKRLSLWSGDGSQFLSTVNMPDGEQPLSVCVDRYNNRLSNSLLFIFLFFLFINKHTKQTHKTKQTQTGTS